MEVAVGGDHAPAALAGGVSLKVAGAAAGFFDEEDSGGDIPGLEFEFPEGIKAARGYVAEVQGRAAVAPDGPRGPWTALSAPWTTL